MHFFLCLLSDLYMLKATYTRSLAQWQNTTTHTVTTPIATISVEHGWCVLYVWLRHSETKWGKQEEIVCVMTNRNIADLMYADASLSFSSSLGQYHFVAFRWHHIANSKRYKLLGDVYEVIIGITISTRSLLMWRMEDKTHFFSNQVGN